MRNAICIGTGMVGHATMLSLGIGEYISAHSKSVEIDQLTNFKYIFICLPTPTIEGKQDISLIESYLSKLNDYKGVVIIRSTVLPGTCKILSEKYNIKIAHVPEFLTESTWEQDSKWPDIIVVGSEDNDLRDEVSGIFKARFKGANYFLTDTVTSETIKYAVNTLYALKVVFANEIFDYATEKGANYETIKKALYARKWIGKNHLDVWHKNGRGASGKCLFKDLDAFANETTSKLLLVANEINKALVIDYPKDGK